MLQMWPCCDTSYFQCLILVVVSGMLYMKTTHQIINAFILPKGDRCIQVIPWQARIHNVFILTVIKIHSHLALAKFLCTNCIVLILSVTEDSHKCPPSGHCGQLLFHRHYTPSSQQQYCEWVKNTKQTIMLITTIAMYSPII